jgi:4-aminobutyrate aminotransferase/(S)-3-amino-2-methylpropionate transaminase
MGNVRGIDAMRTIELVEDRKAKKTATEKTHSFVDRYFERRVILLPRGLHRNVIRLLMPLTITKDQLVKGLNIMDGSLREVYEE